MLHAEGGDFLGSNLHAVKTVEVYLVCENLSSYIPIICAILNVCYTLIKSKQIKIKIFTLPTT